MGCQRSIGQGRNTVSSIKHSPSIWTAACDIHSASIGGHLLGVVEGIAPLITSVQGCKGTRQTLLSRLSCTPPSVVIPGQRIHLVVEGVPPTSFGGSLRG